MERMGRNDKERWQWSSELPVSDFRQLARHEERKGSLWKRMARRNHVRHHDVSGLADPIARSNHDHDNNGLRRDGHHIWSLHYCLDALATRCSRNSGNVNGHGHIHYSFDTSCGILYRLQGRLEVPSNAICVEAYEFEHAMRHGHLLRNVPYLALE